MNNYKNYVRSFFSENSKEGRAQFINQNDSTINDEDVEAFNGLM